MRARAKSATQVASALTQPRPVASADPLQFDFDGRQTRATATPPASEVSTPRDGSIKESIIRWLNEQL